MEKMFLGISWLGKNLFLHQVYFNQAYNAVIDKYGKTYFSYM